MQKTTLEDVDKILGTATEYENVNIYKGKKKVKPSEEFVMMFFSSFNEIIAEHNLTLADLKVLFQIIKYVSYGNLINLSQQDIADGLGVKQQAVNRSWKKLVESEILFSPPGKKSIFINPNFIVKGELLKAKNGEAYQELLKKTRLDLTPYFDNQDELEKAVQGKMRF